MATELTLNGLKRVHVIGVCGTLMGAFAAFLKRRGIHVTGSDQNVYPPMSDVLRSAGVELMTGYRAENLTAQGLKPDLVVIGNVIGADNPEARAAIDGGYRYSSLPESMEQLMLKDTRNIVVAGTHGKTTTSTMMSHLLTVSGRDPAYFFGGVSLDLPFSFHVPGIEAGRAFVLEGDEYDTAFWDKVPKFNHYRPDDVILTSVEFDHADIYRDLAAVVSAFEGLMRRIRPKGRLIACYDYPVIRELAHLAVREAGATLETYGSDPRGGARFTPGAIRVEGPLTCFEIMDHGKGAGGKVDEIRMHVPGNHNVLNALAGWIEARELGVDSGRIRSAFETFKGVKRRQEERGEVNGVLIVDDFAHHPTAVRETLKALRQKYAGRRLVTVFEPRSATSRRKVFQNEYATAFRLADSVFIAVPYDQSRIQRDDQFSSDQLVADLVGSGKSAHLMDTVDAGVAQVALASKRGDVIAVLSNGGFGDFISKLLEALR